MKNTNRIISYAEWTALLLGISLLFGLFTRFFPGFQAGFPLNDGGMFFSMIHDLKNNQFILPPTTSYNQLQIPYAYPPLGFYLAGLVSALFHISEIELLRWLPPIINSISILAVYILATELLKSKSLGALTSAFYALTPGASSWFIMGGGLTRSLGSLFLLLSLFAVYRFFQDDKKKYFFLSVLFCVLAVLSHPEAGVHTAASCVLLWLFFGRTLKSFIKAVAIGVSVLLITSIWWGTVLFYHGIAPFVSALHSGSYGIPLWQAISAIILGRESYLPIMAMLRVIGLCWGLWKKEYFLLAWVIFPYMIEPRSAPSIAFYPLSMLAAMAFANAIPFFVSRLQKRNDLTDEVYKNKLFTASLFLILTYLFVESSLYGFRLVNNSLTPSETESMVWIKENTSSNDSFLILTGVKSPEIDPFIEWFPALAERHSLSTIQGYEWLGAGKFAEYYSDLSQLQGCMSVECVEDWAIQANLKYQYVVIQAEQMGEEVVSSFEKSGKYASIYSNDKVIVFELKDK